MSIEKVRQYFQPLGREQDILEFETSSATVELAAQAAGVIPARIAKTLSFLVDEGCVLIVTAGDAKIDNSKFKAMFHAKAKMLSPCLLYTSDLPVIAIIRDAQQELLCRDLLQGVLDHGAHAADGDVYKRQSPT